MESVPKKVCTKCLQELPATNAFFSVHLGLPGLPERLHPACKKCRAEAMRERRKRGDAPARSKGGKRTKRSDAERVERHRLSRQRTCSNYYLRNVDECLKRSRTYQAKHPEKVRAYRHKRRAREAAAYGNYAPEDVELKLKQQGGKCYWCAKKLGAYHIDHIIPLSKGGLNSAGNICCACPNCNHRKHAKMPWDFSGRLL